MTLLFALVATASFAAGAHAACVPLGEAALEAGLTTLVDTIDMVANLPDAAPLLEAVSATEPLDHELTIVVPTNEAFSEIGNLLASLSPELVLAVLEAHVVPGIFDSTTAGVLFEESPTGVATATTLFGTDLEASRLEPKQIIVTPSGTDIDASLVAFDIPVCAGVVNIVDKVLVPAGIPSGEVSETNTSMDVGVYGDVEAGIY